MPYRRRMLVSFSQKTGGVSSSHSQRISRMRGCLASTKGGWAGSMGVLDGPEQGAAGVGAPGPGVAGPELGDEVQRRRVRAAVGGGDLDQDVVGGGLGVFHHDVEVAVAPRRRRCRRARTPAPPRPGGVLGDQLGIGVGGLGVAVEHALVGVGGGGVEVVVQLLHVLAVVALAVGQAEQALLQEGVLAVPQGDGEAPVQPVVAEAGDAVLAPAIGAAARVVVRENTPRRCLRGCNPPAPCPTGAR